MTKLRLIALIVGAGMLASGCSSSGTPTPTPTPTSARISSTAKLEILAPRQGQAVKADKIPVRISLTGARILKRFSTNITPDTGHVHVSLDSTTLTLLATEQTLDLVALNREAKQPPIANGPHVLQVEFVAADHTPFEPRVLATVTFNVI